MGYSATIDVPDLAAGVAFYWLLGFAEQDRPLPIMAVLGDGGQHLIVMEKAPGTRPCPDPSVRRDYGRHWTPVHLDFHVQDFAGTLDRLVAAGATREALHDKVPGRPPVAFMSDPFGNGFCLLGPRPEASDEC